MPHYMVFSAGRLTSLPAACSGLACVSTTTFQDATIPGSPSLKPPRSAVPPGSRPPSYAAPARHAPGRSRSGVQAPSTALTLSRNQGGRRKESRYSRLATHTLVGLEHGASPSRARDQAVSSSCGVSPGIPVAAGSISGNGARQLPSGRKLNTSRSPNRGHILPVRLSVGSRLLVGEQPSRNRSRHDQRSSAF